MLHPSRLVFALLLLPAVSQAAEGLLESASCETLKGWVYDASQPDAAVSVDVYLDGKPYARLTADQFRQDLADQGYGNGRHAFVYPLPVTWKNHDGQRHTYSLRGPDGVELPGSSQTTRICHPRLNDTGMSVCGTSNTNGACPASGYPGQDAQSGRDRQARSGRLNKLGGGPDGFDYSKIGNDGSELPASATLGSGAKDWACTRDNVTGLIWEVKTDDGGVRDKDNIYTFDKAPTLAASVNQTGLCGATDWRVPNRQELLSLVNYARVNPAINVDYFPNIPASAFWSSSPYVGYTVNAWYVSFSYGYVTNGSRNLLYAVRLVRGG